MQAINNNSIFQRKKKQNQIIIVSYIVFANLIPPPSIQYRPPPQFPDRLHLNHNHSSFFKTWLNYTQSEHPYRFIQISHGRHRSTALYIYRSTEKPKQNNHHHHNRRVRMPMAIMNVYNLIRSYKLNGTDQSTREEWNFVDYNS